MAEKKKYSQGLDIKSLAINLFTILLFLIPFALYYDGEENGYNYVGGLAAVLVLTLIIPPIGWMRPHPYTDYPVNTPWPRRND